MFAKNVDWKEKSWDCVLCFTFGTSELIYDVNTAWSPFPLIPEPLSGEDDGD